MSRINVAQTLLSVPELAGTLRLRPKARSNQEAEEPVEAAHAYPSQPGSG
jgi:hypothetical protein